ncbi:hypothetical protein, partial [Escherichia coli]|uniref:hypothetical protein n=1 Tax=Escherichia coli TaxID=562 RepID=UPI001BC8A444
LQGKISSDGCLKKEQMVVSAIASTPHTDREIPSEFGSECITITNSHQHITPLELMVCIENIHLKCN